MVNTTTLYRFVGDLTSNQMGLLFVLSSLAFWIYYDQKLKYHAQNAVYGDNQTDVNGTRLRYTINSLRLLRNSTTFGESLNRLVVFPILVAFICHAIPLIHDQGQIDAMQMALDAFHSYFQLYIVYQILDNLCAPWNDDHLPARNGPVYSSLLIYLCFSWRYIHVIPLLCTIVTTYLNLKILT